MGRDSVAVWQLATTTTTNTHSHRSHTNKNAKMAIGHVKDEEIGGNKGEDERGCVSEKRKSYRKPGNDDDYKMMMIMKTIILLVFS